MPVFKSENEKVNQLIDLFEAKGYLQEYNYEGSYIHKLLFLYGYTRAYQQNGIFKENNVDSRWDLEQLDKTSFIYIAIEEYIQKTGKSENILKDSNAFGLYILMTGIMVFDTFQFAKSFDKETASIKYNKSKPREFASLSSDLLFNTFNKLYFNYECLITGDEDLNSVYNDTIYYGNIKKQIESIYKRGILTKESFITGKNEVSYVSYDKSKVSKVIETGNTVIKNPRNSIFLDVVSTIPFTLLLGYTARLKELLKDDKILEMEYIKLDNNTRKQIISINKHYLNTIYTDLEMSDKFYNFGNSFLDKLPLNIKDGNLDTVTQFVMPDIGISKFEEYITRKVNILRLKSFKLIDKEENIEEIKKYANLNFSMFMFNFTNKIKQLKNEKEKHEIITNVFSNIGVDVSFENQGYVYEIKFNGMDIENYFNFMLETETEMFKKEIFKLYESNQLLFGNALTDVNKVEIFNDIILEDDIMSLINN